jgi:S-adenosylmethionine decarboxylase proenzyme
MGGESRLNSLGTHLLVEFYDCDKKILNDEVRIEQVFIEAAKKAKATVVEQVFHRFSPHGVSGVVVISESHLAVHTWPEYGYAAVDVFTCGTEIDPWVAQEFIREALHATNSTAIEMKRGTLQLPYGQLTHKPLDTIEKK